MPKREIPYQLFVATALLLFMAGLLIFNLGRRDVWGDEGWSIWFTNGATPHETTLAMTQDRHPPLYFLALDVWRGAVGSAEAPMRMLAVYAALLGGAFLYRLGRALFDPATGAFALLIFALMDKQIIFSQEVRHYSWFMLWVVAASLALARWERGSRWAGAGYTAALVGGLYTHSLMVVVVAAHGCYALVATRPLRRWLPLLGLWALALLAFAPWLLVSVYQYLTRGGVTPSLPLTWESIQLLTPEMLGKPLVLTIGLVGLGVWHNWRAARLPLAIILLPLLLVLLLTGESVTLLNDRNLSMLLPMLALLMGAGVALFRGFGRRALVAFLILNALLTHDAQALHPPWRAIAHYIAQRQIDQQPLVLDVGGANPALSYHLTRALGAEVPQASTLHLLWQREADPTFDPLSGLYFNYLNEQGGFWLVHWSNDTTFLRAPLAWGFVDSGVHHWQHFDGQIAAYRFDSATLMTQHRARFGELFSLHTAVFPAEARESLTVSLWWSAQQTPPADYTVSVFLLDAAGVLVAQHDAYPQNLPTSTWLSNALYYDSHTISLQNTPPGRYHLGVKVYNGEGVLPTSGGAAYITVGELGVLP